MRTSNFVLYAIGDDAAPRPLISCAVGDDSAALKFAHAASQEYRRCDMSGVPASRVVLLKEQRESDEAGKLVGVKYTRCDPTSQKEIGAPCAEREIALKDGTPNQKKESA